MPEFMQQFTDVHSWLPTHISGLMSLNHLFQNSLNSTWVASVSYITPVVLVTKKQLRYGTFYLLSFQNAIFPPPHNSSE